MILTHLVLYSFLGGASNAAAPQSFGGILPFGFYALALEWSNAAPVVGGVQHAWRGAFNVWHRSSSGTEPPPES